MKYKSAQDCFAQICLQPVPDHPWIVTDTRIVSYKQLAARVRRMAGLLRTYHVRQGERVLFSTHDDVEASLLFVSLLANGVVAVNVDSDTGSQRALALIQRAKPTLLILDSVVRKRWAVPATVVCIEIDGEKPVGLFASLRKKPAPGTLQALLEMVQPESPPQVIEPETLAYILFTSGTTRDPKGVCISHRALFSHLQTLSTVYGYDPASAILNTLMLSHADGMIQGPLAAFYNSATLHRPLMFAVSTLESLLDSVYQLRITHMIAVPTMLSLMTRLSEHQRDSFQGGDFKLLVSCGAALEPAVWEQAEKKFAVSILNVYGLTETVVGGVFAGTAVGTLRRDQVGRPIDCELKIVGEHGEIFADTPGELLIKGDLLMSGYFDDPAQTQAVLQDGWLHTGDIAFRHEDGGYSIVGRKKSIVIRGGYNIHPEEIVEVLKRDPEVRDAIAFGLPDADWGEKLIAMVEAGQADERSLLERCRADLEPRKVPSRVIVVDTLPRGRSGKIALEAARELYEAHGKTSTPAVVPGQTKKNVEDAVLQLASRCFRVDRSNLNLHSTPRDVLGWDSLAHMELVVALETEFGISFSPRDVTGLDSLEKAYARVLAG